MGLRKLFQGLVIAAAALLPGNVSVYALNPFAALRYEGAFSYEERRFIENGLSQIYKKLPKARYKLDLVFKKHYLNNGFGKSVTNSSYYLELYAKDPESASALFEQAKTLKAEYHTLRTLYPHDSEKIDQIHSKVMALAEKFERTEEDVVLIGGKQKIEAAIEEANSSVRIYASSDYQGAVIHEVCHHLVGNDDETHQILAREIEEINKAAGEEDYVSAYADYPRYLLRAKCNNEKIIGILNRLKPEIESGKSSKSLHNAKFYIENEISKSEGEDKETLEAFRGVLTDPELGYDKVSKVITVFEKKITEKSHLVGSKLSEFSEDPGKATDEDIAETATYWITGQTYKNNRVTVVQKVNRIRSVLEKLYAE